MESASLPFDFTSGTLSRSLRLFSVLQKAHSQRSAVDLLDITTVLSSVPLLRSFQSAELLESLAREFDLEVGKKGECVYAAGDEAACFYIVVEGAVELRTDTDVRVVRAGGDFGQTAEGQVRQETALVKENVKLMALPLSTYEGVLKTFESQQNQSKRLFLRSTEAFEDLSDGEMDQLADNGHLRSFADLSVIVAQGQFLGGIHYITSGEVKLVRTLTGRESIVIDRLEVGDAIGDLAALTRQPVQYTALAQGRVDCLYLEKSVLLELEKEHWHRLQVLAKPYPPDSQLQAAYAQHVRWEQYKSSLVLDVKAQQLKRSLHS